MHHLTWALSLGGGVIQTEPTLLADPDHSLSYFYTKNSTSIVNLHQYLQVISWLVFSVTVQGNDCGYVPVFVFAKCSNKPFPCSLVLRFQNWSEQNLSFENEFDLRWVNTFYYEWFRIWTRLRTKDNLEMAYWINALWKSIRARYWAHNLVDCKRL